jgi:hypothetical protein
MKRFLINMCLGLAVILTSCEKETREAEVAVSSVPQPYTIASIYFAPSIPFNDLLVEPSAYRIFAGGQLVYQNLQMMNFVDEPAITMSRANLNVYLYDLEGTILLPSDTFNINMTTLEVGYNDIYNDSGGLCGMLIER